MKGGIDFHTHPVLVREMIARHPELVAAAREQYYIRQQFSAARVLPSGDGRRGAGQGGDPADRRDHRRGYATSTATSRSSSSARCQRSAGRFRQRRSAQGFRARTSLSTRFANLGLARFETRAAHAGVLTRRRSCTIPSTSAPKDLGIPILFHAGMSWEPGSRLKYGHPLRFEDVAADFPKLRIVLAHLAWPWVVDAVALALEVSQRVTRYVGALLRQSARFSRPSR